ncbi:hypothetical protein B0T20DRAFT_230288 [Sordaria brevicollis]|uniref:Uncharacterized protein n=1 Tax=Sordaria brevicollis TaxID=83679 RepID=A0AAE0PDD0_SORBR|nr:hypothetical protein B0T20DRAFT_230288 [Sordaria brevicollis]
MIILGLSITLRSSTGSVLYISPGQTEFHVIVPQYFADDEQFRLILARNYYYSTSSSSSFALSPVLASLASPSFPCHASSVPSRLASNSLSFTLPYQLVTFVLPVCTTRDTLSFLSVPFPASLCSNFLQFTHTHTEL